MSYIITITEQGLIPPLLPLSVLGLPGLRLPGLVLGPGPGPDLGPEPWGQAYFETTVKP
jgi:hypothetical protein